MTTLRGRGVAWRYCRSGVGAGALRSRAGLSRRASSGGGPRMSGGGTTSIPRNWSNGADQQHLFTQSIEDTQVCIDALKAKGPVFIVGYCYGGSVVWAAACRCHGLAAGSSYYGSLVPQFAEEQPKCQVICLLRRTRPWHSHGRHRQSACHPS